MRLRIKVFFIALNANFDMFIILQFFPATLILVAKWFIFLEV